jgi:septal ring-binding cell division protein DamX
VHGMDEMNNRITELERKAEQPQVAVKPPVPAKPRSPAEIKPLPPAKPREESPVATVTPEPVTDPWSEARKTGAYTLQILGARKQEGLSAYARRHKIVEDSAIIEAELKGQPWYVLVHGIHDSRSKAKAAVKSLEKQIPGSKPWVKPIPKTGTIRGLK